MSKIPSPEERPDLYDGYDCEKPSKPASDAYWNGIMSPALKKLTNERRKKDAERKSNAE